MTDDKTWEFVERSLSIMRDQGDRLKEATDRLHIAPESPLLETHWIVEDAFTRALDRLIGDDYDNISWYVYECDYGRSPNEAGKDGDMRLIDSVQKLRWLVEL